MCPANRVEPLPTKLLLIALSESVQVQFLCSYFPQFRRSGVRIKAVSQMLSKATLSKLNALTNYLQ